MEGMVNRDELLREGRQYAINAILAYAEAFELIAPDQIDEEVMANINEGLRSTEALIPVLKSMYEATKALTSNPDLTFMEWLNEVANKSGGKEFDLF